MLSPSSAVVTWTAGSLGLYLCTNVMHKNCLNSGASLDPPSFSRRIYDNKEIYNISVWVFHPVSKAMKCASMIGRTITNKQANLLGWGSDEGWTPVSWTWELLIWSDKSVQLYH